VRETGIAEDQARELIKLIGNDASSLLREAWLLRRRRCGNILAPARLMTSMSTRGINFGDRWMAEHLPNAMSNDPVAVSDLADDLMTSAEQEGIPTAEINEEIDSVYEVIFEAMHHREGSAPD
jgi:hypothetical protein